MSRPGLKKMLEGLYDATQRLDKHVEDRRWSFARDNAKDAARFAGQLLQRLTIMAEMELEDEGD